jgi:hypothetical protein
MSRLPLTTIFVETVIGLASDPASAAPRIATKIPNSIVGVIVLISVFVTHPRKITVSVLTI